MEGGGAGGFGAQVIKPKLKEKQWRVYALWIWHMDSRCYGRNFTAMLCLLGHFL